MHIFWARQASFGHLTLISDPLNPANIFLWFASNKILISRYILGNACIHSGKYIVIFSVGSFVLRGPLIRRYTFQNENLNMVIHILRNVCSCLLIKPNLNIASYIMLFKAIRLYLTDYITDMLSQISKHMQSAIVTMASALAGLQIYGGPGSLSHDFKIWPITFQGIGPSGLILLCCEQISL